MHICSLNIVDCTVMRLFSFFSVQVREGDATGSTKWDGVAFAVKNWSVNLANSTPKKEKEDEAKMLTKMVDLMRCTEEINSVPTYPIPHETTEQEGGMIPLVEKEISYKKMREEDEWKSRNNWRETQGTVKEVRRVNETQLGREGGICNSR